MFELLTDAETDRLWWRIVRAIAAVADEVESLELAPARLRDELYGTSCLELYAGMMDELGALADELGDSPLADAITPADTSPEEGTSRWHDSEVRETTPLARKLRLLAATLRANCPGRSRAATLRSFLRKCSRRSWTR